MFLVHLCFRSRQAARLLARLDAAAPPPGPLPAGLEWDWDAALARLEESGGVQAPALELDSDSTESGDDERATSAAGSSAAAGKLGSGLGGHDVGDQGLRHTAEGRATEGSAVRQSDNALRLSTIRTMSGRQGGAGPISKSGGKGSVVRQSENAVRLSVNRSVGAKPGSSSGGRDTAKAATVRLSDGLHKSIRQSGAGSVRQSDRHPIHNGAASVGARKSSGGIDRPPQKSQSSLPSLDHSSQLLKQASTHDGEASIHADTAHAVPSQEHTTPDSRGENHDNGASAAAPTPVAAPTRHSTIPTDVSQHDSADKTASSALVSQTVTCHPHTLPGIAAGLSKSGDGPPCSAQPDLDQPASPGVGNPPWTSRHPASAERNDAPGSGSNSRQPDSHSVRQPDSHSVRQSDSHSDRLPDSHPVRQRSDSRDDSSSCYHSGNSSLRASWQDQEAAAMSAARSSTATLSAAAAAAQKCQPGREVVRGEAGGHQEGEGDRYGSAQKDEHHASHQGKLPGSAQEEEHHACQQAARCGSAQEEGQPPSQQELPRREPHEQHSRAPLQSYAGQQQRKEELLRTPRQGPQPPACASPAQPNPIQSASRGSTPSRSSIKAARSLDFGGKGNGNQPVGNSIRNIGGRVGRADAVARSVAVAGARGGPRGASNSPSRAGSGYAQQHEAATIARNNGGRTSLQVCMQDQSET